MTISLKSLWVCHCRTSIPYLLGIFGRWNWWGASILRFVYIFPSLLLNFLLNQIVGLLKDIFWWCFRFCFEIKINWYKFLQSCTNSYDITTQHNAMPSTQHPIHLQCTSLRCYDKWSRAIVWGSHLSHWRFHPPIRMIYHRDKQIYAHNTLHDSA